MHPIFNLPLCCLPLQSALLQCNMSQNTFSIKNQWIIGICLKWLSESRWPRIIDMWAKSLNKWESWEKFNHNSSRLFKAIWHEEKSMNKSDLHDLLSVNDWTMTSDSMLYVSVWGTVSPVVRNKLGLWLDSSICWKSLAGGSKRRV